MTQHVMIDIETMGTCRDAVILSIGAVLFDRNKIYEDGGFYENLSWQEQLDNGGTVTEGTIKFWLRQPSGPRDALFGKKALSPNQAINKFNLWFQKQVQKPNDCNVWAKGPAFDLSLLGDLYQRLNLGAPPWPYRAERCVRTAEMMPGVNTISRPKDEPEHHAFHDAVHQARVVRKFLIACGGPAKPPKKEEIEDDLLG